MTITHSVPSDQRTPGRYFEFLIAASQRGLITLDQRIALVGQMSTAGDATAAVAIQVESEADAEARFGQGSELDLMVKWALKGARRYGKQESADSMCEIWAIPITNPAVDGSNTKAAWTFTITGTATADGDLVVKIGGVEIRAGVTNGDVANTVAASLENAIDAKVAELGFTAGVSTNVVTITAVMTGVNGNDPAVEGVSAPAGISNAVAQSVTAIGAVDITASLDALVDRDYDFVVAANHTSTDISDFAAHLTSMWGSGTKRWRFTMLAETGSLATGQALATAADDFKQCVISAEGFPQAPYEIAAYLAGILGSEPNPNKPFNHYGLPDLYLPSAADAPTPADVKSGINGGMIMLDVEQTKKVARLVRAVTTKVTHSSVPNYSLLDLGDPRALAWLARQVDARLERDFPRAKQNARSRKRIRSAILDVMHQAEAETLEVLQNVDDVADQLTVVEDSGDDTRLIAAIPADVVPNLAQVINVISMIV